MPMLECAIVLFVARRDNLAEPMRDRIRKLRETMSLTQVQFADLVRKRMPHKGGPHPSTVARWENGSSVPGGEYYEVLRGLAKDAGLIRLFDTAASQ